LEANCNWMDYFYISFSTVASHVYLDEATLFNN
jgi:hypothetical protein